MTLLSKLHGILARYKELESLLSQGPSQAAAPQAFPEWSREYNRLSPLIQEMQVLERLYQDKEDLREMMNDPELRAWAQEEDIALEEKIRQQEGALKLMLLPSDEDDSRNAIIEIRAGTGGEEAALFAGNLLRMYRRYAENKRWSVELLQLHESERGGVKEVGLSISGPQVFSRLKFEAGVHRVQRVPDTEASGRIHTSAATVAVLPEAEEVDIQIEDKDLRIDVFRSSGPGGQSVNTTDSAVRITHLPTGLVVQQQDEKSQHKNKAKALKVLRARLYEKKREEEMLSRAASRKSQVGRGDRSERIRTYNFPQSRVTDHRIGLTLLNKLDKVLEGEALDEIIEALLTEDRTQRLAEEMDNF